MVVRESHPKSPDHSGLGMVLICPGVWISTVSHPKSAVDTLLWMMEGKRIKLYHSFLPNDPCHLWLEVRQAPQKGHSKEPGNGMFRSPRWWFQIFFICTLTWGNDPIWQIFFGWVGSATNQSLGCGSFFCLWRLKVFPQPMWLCGLFLPANPGGPLQGGPRANREINGVKWGPEKSRVMYNYPRKIPFIFGHL